MRRAAQAMSALKSYLESERGKANDKYAFGADLFAQMVKQTEQVDLPVAQIEAAGRADLERNTAALKAECNGYAPQGFAWRNAWPRWLPTSQKPVPVEEARAQLKMLKEFIVKNNVVSIPNNDEALVAEAPPLQSLQRRVHQYRGTLRQRCRVDLQHRAAGSQVEQGRAGRVHSRRGLAAVHLGARSLAGALPAIPAFECQSRQARSDCGWAMRMPKAGRTTARK